jgi:excisionase family DNA binding protein
MEASMDDELFTPEEAAKFLRIAKVTLYRYTKDREISVVKRGRYVRYRKSDLVAFIDRYTIKREENAQ